MADSPDPLRRVFAGLVAMPSPTLGQTESARQALLTAMRNDTTRSRALPRRLVGLVIAAVLVLVVGLTVVVPWNRSPASAILGEVAEATRRVSPLQLPAGAYVYVSTDSLTFGQNAALEDGEYVYVSYLLPRYIEAWWQGDDVEKETTTDPPIFFDQGMEDFYYEHGLDASDFVGETRTDVFAGVANMLNPAEWSTDPDELAEQIRRSAEADASPQPIDVKMMNLAGELLDPHLLASPELRAAILDVITTLHVDVKQLDDGRVSVSVTYEYFGTVTTAYIFDNAGYLVERRSTTLTGDEELGLPPGTVYEDVTQTPPEIVSELGMRPSH